MSSSSDGTIKTPRTADSTTPIMPRYTYAPNNFRDIMQRQIQATTDRAIDQAVSLTIDGDDGRFFSNLPGKTVMRENKDGQFFHMVGVNRGGDLSVAAP